MLVAVSNAFGRVQTIVCDLNDRTTNSVDANGVTITNIFDKLGRLLSRGYPDGGVEKFGYSAAGLIAHTNQLGFTNFYAYDAAGRKTFETNANREITQFQYDSSGNLTNLLDGKTNSTRWTFDQFNRATNKIDALTSIIFTYQYDADNRLTNRWTPSSSNTVYRYDAAGNLTNIDHSVGTGSTPSVNLA